MNTKEKKKEFSWGKYVDIKVDKRKVHEPNQNLGEEYNIKIYNFKRYFLFLGFAAKTDLSISRSPTCVIYCAVPQFCSD